MFFNLLPDLLFVGGNGLHGNQFLLSVVEPIDQRIDLSLEPLSDGVALLQQGHPFITIGIQSVVPVHDVLELTVDMGLLRAIGVGRNLGTHVDEGFDARLSILHQPLQEFLLLKLSFDDVTVGRWRFLISNQFFSLLQPLEDSIEKVLELATLQKSNVKLSFAVMQLNKHRKIILLIPQVLLKY